MPLFTGGIPVYQFTAIKSRQKCGGLWYMTGPQGTTFSDWTWSLSGIPGWTIAGIADFNGDATPDVIWQNDATRQATVWYMGPAGQGLHGWNWLMLSPLPGWKIAAAY